MKRYFLIIFFSFLSLNAVYKSYVYFSSDKVAGTVTALVRYNVKYVSRSPMVSYTFKNYKYETSRNEWSYINQLEINDQVTVLIGKDEEVNLNTPFQFWLTFYDMMALLLLCIIGTAILETIIPAKEKAPKTWK